MDENISVTAENKKNIFLKEYLVKMFKANLFPTVLLTAFWMVLGWIRTAGIQWAILWPLNFLTGALNGLNGSAVGGMIGKTILLILFNSAFRGVVVQRGELKKRGEKLLEEIKEESIAAVLKKIPQYSNLKVILKGGTPQSMCYGGFGASVALLIYPFITSDGNLVNSMVCIALFLNISKQLIRQRGFIITIVNILLEKRSWKTINKDVINRIVAGFSVGMAAVVPIAVSVYIPWIGRYLWRILAKLFPWMLLAISFAGKYWDKFEPMIKR